MMVGPDRVDGQHGHRGAGPHRLVEEDELLDGRPALAAVLVGPADAQPAVLGHLLDHPAHVGADAVAVGQLGLDLGGEQVGVVVAERGRGAPLAPRCSRSPLRPSRSCLRRSARRASPGPTLDCRAAASRTVDAERPWSRRGRRRRGRSTGGPLLEHVTFDPSGTPPPGAGPGARPASLPRRRVRRRSPLGLPCGKFAVTRAGPWGASRWRRLDRSSALSTSSHPSAAAPPPRPEEHHMPEAVIVATGRTPIGRANKGSLVDCRPDDLAALVIREVLAKVPQLDPSRSRT